MKSYSTYIFDWDGTLAKTLDIWLEGYRQQFKIRGFDYSDAEIISLFGEWQGVSRLGVDDGKKFFEDMEPFLQLKMMQAELYAEVSKTLKYLHERNYQLAIYTNSSRQRIKPVLNRFKLTKTIYTIVDGEQVRHHKPDPDGINQILKKLNSDSRTSIMIGDSDKDIEAAHNAGIDSAIFYPPEHSLYYQLDVLKQSQPTFIINSHQELIT